MFDDGAREALPGPAASGSDGQRPSQPLAGAVAALADLASILTDPSDSELVEALAGVEAVGRRVDALRVRLAGLVADRSRRDLGPGRLSARFGCRNAGELVTRVTGVAGITAGRRIRLGAATNAGRGLSGEAVPAAFPAVARALEAGALGVDAAHAIVTALEPARRVAAPDHVAAAERELVTAVTGGGGAPAAGGTDGQPPAADACQAGDFHRAPAVDADTVRLQAKVWLEYLDPDGAAPSEQDRARRFVTLHPLRHGLVPVSGLLLPDVASALAHYADACTSPRTAPVPQPASPSADVDRDDDRDDDSGAGLPDAAGPAEAAKGAGAAAATFDDRSRAQVMHDVLATIVQVAARAIDAPSVAGNAPTLVVIATAADLAAGRGVAHTQDGSAVSIATARHVGCAGAVQRVVVDTSGRIAGIGSAERCFTGPQRRAIMARDRGCVIPGCHVPASWCEVHHVTPYADDPGGTHTDNGVLLCWHHHRTIDTAGWTIRLVDGLVWIRPPTWIDRTGRWRRHDPGTRRRLAA